MVTFLIITGRAYASNYAFSGYFFPSQKVLFTDLLTCAAFTCAGAIAGGAFTTVVAGGGGGGAIAGGAVTGVYYACSRGAGGAGAVASLLALSIRGLLQFSRIEHVSIGVNSVFLLLRR